MEHSTINPYRLTIGIDLGDRSSQFCVRQTSDGAIREENKVDTTPEALQGRFGEMEQSRIVIETGTHSPWVSRLLEERGHEVIVANSRKVPAIYTSDRKNDRQDARMLSKIGRLDAGLLFPVQHRKTQTQADLSVLRARDELVETRTKLINHVRGAVRAIGKRLAKCSAPSFHKRAAEGMPEILQPALTPLLEVIGQLSCQIRQCDRQVEKTAQERYPQSQVLMQVAGVGALTALAFMLTLEDPRRFKGSRSVGTYLGLTPREQQSGESSAQLRISKAGDGFVRRLLVGSAQYILGPFGPDSDLRRKGLAIAERGGKNAKKRAMVAVARRLAVLLHALWMSGEVYEPLRNSARKEKAIA